MKETCGELANFGWRVIVKILDLGSVCELAMCFEFSRKQPKLICSRHACLLVLMVFSAAKSLQTGPIMVYHEVWLASDRALKQLFPRQISGR